MERLSPKNFAATQNSSWQRATTHLDKAATAKSPEEVENELNLDKEAKAILDEFAQVGQAFLENDQQVGDLNSNPGQVALSKTSHRVGWQMAREAGVGLFGLASGLLRGFDKVVTGPETTGVAHLRENGGSNFLDRIDSMEAKVEGWNMGIKMPGRGSVNYSFHRHENGSPILKKVSEQVWNSVYDTPISTYETSLPTTMTIVKTTSSDTLTFNSNGKIELKQESGSEKTVEPFGA